jgi:protein-disulfide isomerase
MKYSALVLPLIVCSLLIGCGGSKNITFNNSGIEYVYKPAEKPGIAASYDGTEVSEKQLLSQSPALDELNSVEDEMIIALTFLYAYNKYGDDLKANKKVSIVSYKPEPKKKSQAQILAHLGLQPNRNVLLKYAKPKGDPNIIATVNNVDVTMAELNTNHFRFYGLKKRQFREMMARLQGIVVRGSLLKAASEDKQNIEQYIKDEISSGVTVTDEDIAEFMKKSHISEADVKDEKTKEKIKLIVEEGKKNQLIEKHVAKKLLDNPVVIHFKPPEAVFAISPSMAVNWGYKSAPITVALFSDFTCAPCVEMGKDLIEIRDDYAGQLKISFNHFFSDQDRTSRMLAEASMCVYSQGNKYFGKFFDKYVSENLPPDEETIYKTVTAVGADLEEFKKCFLTRAHKNLVDDHLKYARSIGVAYQPTLLVDDEIVEGAISAQDLERLFDRKIAQRGDSWIRAFFRRITGF